ncbi:MAG: hypothetical protein UHN47_07765 [Lachnospiraceae bacterium]|nr:hypothetical protein [Lachnospiraceae bacterium]
MDLNRLKENSNYYFSDESSSVRDAAYYSLCIGIEAYLNTYHNLVMSLTEYDRKDSNQINMRAKESEAYIRSYVDIAIHFQHFFELEIKKCLEKENKLLAVDTKGNPVITYKLLNAIELEENEVSSLKSVEFSEALGRLKKLVNGNYVTSDVAKVLVKNDKLLDSLNLLRNTVLHRGRRILNYCDLDMLMTQNILPAIKELFDLSEYVGYVRALEQQGLYSLMTELINIGKKEPFEYDTLALKKEIGRCSLNRKTIANLDNNNEDDKDYLELVLERSIEPCLNERYIREVKCPCCNSSTMIEGADVIGMEIDELGDEMGNGAGFSIIHIPVYMRYKNCLRCGLSVDEFLFDKI